MVALNGWAKRKPPRRSMKFKRHRKRKQRDKKDSRGYWSEGYIKKIKAGLK